MQETHPETINVCFLYLLCSVENAWLVQIIHPYVTVHTHPFACVGGCVGSSLFLCICIFSHAENGKQVMCEPVWGGMGELPLYLPSCLFTVHKEGLHLSWPHPFSPVSPSCSTEDSKVYRVSRGLAMRPPSSWEFCRKPGVKSPLCGGRWGEGVHVEAWAKEGVFSSFFFFFVGQVNVICGNGPGI